MKDLVILVADKNTEFSLKGILSRHQSIGIRDISQTTDIYVHIQRDPGCYNQCVDFLRPFIKEYNYALVIFDHEGSGQEQKSREEIETKLESELNVSGWDQQVAVIVLEPELEIWVWSDSPHVERILGWENCVPNLRDWLFYKNYFQKNETKPERPKEAMEAAVENVKKPRSSAIYQQLAENVSFRNCRDEGFLKLKETLQNWFS